MASKVYYLQCSKTSGAKRPVSIDSLWLWIHDLV